MSDFDFVGNPDEAKEYWPRYKFFYFALGVTLIIFLCRLWYLQIIEGHELREFSEKNRIKQHKVNAPRGLILDRDGKVLVENLPGFEAILMPQYMENAQSFSETIGPILGYEPEKLAQRIQKSRKQNGVFSQIRLKDNLSREEVFRLKRVRLETPGLEIRESIVRHYPLSQNGAQLFGYVTEISKRELEKRNSSRRYTHRYLQGDLIGKGGLEERLESDIRGIDGMSYIQVDAHGRETITQSPNVYGEQIRDLEPIHGNNAVLTIDRDIQEAAFNSMKQLGRIGALVAMKSNGEILAWLSEPSFDPNSFSTGISTQRWRALINDPFKPLRNKVIQDHYPPGSTFKPFVALAALQENEISANSVVSAPGLMMFGGRPYHDSIRGGHGNITVLQAIERSSNIFFYKMGIALGVDKIAQYSRLLGLGQLSGIDLPREIPGNIPDSTWKKNTFGEDWQPGENLTTAIGQGFVNTTLLQLALGYNTIGAEGKVYKPFVVRKIIDQDGKTLSEFLPTLLRDVSQRNTGGAYIDKQHFKTVKEGMRRVANSERGTSRHWKIPGLEMAGKTGTAQVMNFTADQIYVKCETRPINMRHHGWYVAYAPAENPEITVGVFAEHGCHGSTGGAPIARDVIQAYFKKYHPEVLSRGLQMTSQKIKNTAEAPLPEALENE
jgi:penicillin-binding protein 2